MGLFSKPEAVEETATRKVFCGLCGVNSSVIAPAEDLLDEAEVQWKLEHRPVCRGNEEDPMDRDSPAPPIW